MVTPGFDCDQYLCIFVGEIGFELQATSYEQKAKSKKLVASSHLTLTPTPKPKLKLLTPNSIKLWHKNK